MKKLCSIVLSLLMLVSLYGCKKAENAYTINYNTKGGSFIEATVITGEGKTLSRPTDPNKEGSIFDHWELNGEVYDFSKPVGSSFTLVAVYREDTPESHGRTVTVVVSGKQKTMQFAEGEKIVLDTPAPDNGHAFFGWYVDGKPADPNEAKDGSLIEAIFDSRVACTDIKMEYNKFYAYEGGKSWSLFGFTPVPSNTTDTLNFSVEDDSIVKVTSEGLVTPGRVGQTVIHVKCGDIEKTVKFDTYPREISKLESEQYDLRIQAGGSDRLKIKITPENAADKTLKYSSVNKNVATVDKNGIVFGNHPGMTYIDVESVNGVKTQVPVYVQGEEAFLEVPNMKDLQSGSGQQLPVKIIYVFTNGSTVQTLDLTDKAVFKTSYTSALAFDAPGRCVYASGAIYETTDVSFSFEVKSPNTGTTLYTESAKVKVVK